MTSEYKKNFRSDYYEELRDSNTLCNELSVYFGGTRDEANSFALDFKNGIELPMGDDTFECDGYYEAGDEDGTVWRIEFTTDKNSFIELNDAEIVKTVFDVASNYEVKIAYIVHRVDDDFDPVDLFNDEDFVYCS